MLFHVRIIRALFLTVLMSFGVIGTQVSASGPVILTISGQIDGDVVAFDREMLEALDWREIRTWTSFIEGEQVFAGPTLKSVLSAVGAKGTKIRAIAINDYAVDIPVEHAEMYDVLLALDHNGRTMRVRNKGPVWVIYPQTEAEASEHNFDAEMIWQLDRIAVE
ncbi:MAG: molybdopterin-dependent oxidoreductase [Paracoccaceae bacterium]